MVLDSPQRRSSRSFIFGETLMIARTMRAFPGLLVSMILVTSPAFADPTPDNKHRLASYHRRVAPSARHARFERHVRVRRAHEDAAASTPDELAAFAPGQDTGGTGNGPRQNQSRQNQSIESGVASWYGPRHQGHITSSGRHFDQNELTAAHPWLPLGTRVRVSLPGTDRSVEVTITDRPGNRRRIIDLSREAARQLGFLRQGTAHVTLSRL
jgi:peptidoglycan lytic transglycosylase